MVEAVWVVETVSVAEKVLAAGADETDQIVNLKESCFQLSRRCLRVLRTRLCDFTRRESKNERRKERIIKQTRKRKKRRLKRR